MQRNHAVVVGLLAAVVLAAFQAGCEPYTRAPVRRVDDGRVAQSRPAVVQEVPPVAGAPREQVREIPPILGSTSGVVIAGGPAALDPYMVYNKATETSVRGAINGFSRVRLTGDRTGLFARINAGGSFPYIYLGPEEWLFLNDIHPDMTDQIFAEGSRSGQVLLARRIILDGFEFELRDVNGNPHWNEPPVAAARATPADRAVR